MNVLNDYYDDANGTDGCNTQRVFPFTGGSRFIQNGVLSAGEMLVFGALLLAVAMLLGIGLAWVSSRICCGSGVAGVLLGVGYSALPLRLNSRGLGEPDVALGFGILTPLGAWLVQTGEVAMYPVLISVPAALLVMNILFINQFPDRESDAASGKHHWVVRLGHGESTVDLSGIGGIGGHLGAVVGHDGDFAAVVMLSLLPLGLAFKAGMILRDHAHQPALLEPAIKMTIASMILHGLLLSLTLWLV